MMFQQLDPHQAKAPIVLNEEKSEDDSVVQWIRQEFTELDKASLILTN